MMAFDLVRRRDEVLDPTGARQAVSADGLFCAAGGVASFVASPVLARLMEVPAWTVAAVAAAVATWGAVLLAAVTRRRWVEPAARAAVVANVLWLLGTVVAVAAGDQILSAAGRLVLSAVAVPVALLGAWQWRVLQVEDAFRVRR